MTIEEHYNLYDELKKVIYTRGYNTRNLTQTQTVFIHALEQAAFGSEFLKVYAELIDETPDISVRNLHAFCLGFGIGLSGNVNEIEISKNKH